MEKNLNYIGNLVNGSAVYDREDSHWKNGHKDVKKELLIEALGKLVIPEDESETLIVQEIDMGRVIGKSTCVTIDENDQTFMAKRKNRDLMTNIVINREPQDCDKMVVILRKNEDGYKLITTYIGRLAPREPGDPGLNGIDEIKESNEFWSSHALIYKRDEVEYIMSPNGEQLAPEDFEEKYIQHSSDSTDFDFPKDAMIMLMGMSASGKSTLANVIAKRYPYTEIISSDNIRENMFKKEIENKEDEKVFSSNSKGQVYDEMISQIENNMKEGKTTIADATFLLEKGVNARKQIYELTQKYGIPLRVIILKAPLKLAKHLNKQRSRVVDENVLEIMWNNMESNYDEIVDEIKMLPNAKCKTINTETLISKSITGKSFNDGEER